MSPYSVKFLYWINTELSQFGVGLLVSDNDRSHECNAEMYVERKASGASAWDRDAMILHVHIRDIIVNISGYMAS